MSRFSLDNLRDRWHRCLEAAGGLRELALHLLFWGLLTVAVSALIRPLWVGAIPPLTDFGGHVAMADVWARYDEVELYRDIYEFRSGLAPNLMSARFARWLHPWIETMPAVRLFVSLTMIGTVAGLLGILYAFERSRWLIFLALPFLWNGSIYWGMINYLAAFPFFFGSIALARQTGMTGDWRWGLSLMAACTACFFMHGLGAPFTFGAAAFTLACSLKRWRDTLYLLTFAPGVGLWMYWRSQAEGRQGFPEGGIVEVLRQEGEWFLPMKNVKQFFHHTLDPVTAPEDTAFQVGLIGLWIVLMGLSTYETERASDSRHSPTNDDTESVGWPRRIGRWITRHLSAGYVEIREHTLLLVVMGLAVAAAVFPAYIVHTNINTRVMDLLVLAAPLLPRLPERSWLATVACGVAVALSIGFGVYMTNQAEAFYRQETRPLERLIEKIPEQQRVECLGVRGGTQPVFRGRPWDHNCHGLIQVERSSFGGCSFPETGFNPVTYREDAGYPSLLQSQFRDVGRLQQWDYVVYRGSHSPPNVDVIQRVATVGDAREGWTEWTLYRVVDSTLEADYEEVAGGSGGYEFQWHCSEGKAVAGVEGTLAPRADYVGTIRPLCRPVSYDGDVPELRGRTIEGPQLGTIRGHDPFQVRCPQGMFVIGARGREGDFVDRLRLVCGRLEKASDAQDNAFQTVEEQETQGAGGKGGESYEMMCPDGSIVRGMRGRSGSFVDAAGIQCVEARRLLDEDSEQ